MPVPHPAPLSLASYSAMELALEDDVLWVLDQRRLPHEEHYLRIADPREAIAAISEMAVRGAPAIGITAAYALALQAHVHRDERAADRRAGLEAFGAALANARPTAVNLAWAVETMLAGGEHDPRALAEKARKLHRDDVAACREIGRRGAALLPKKATILTHCNAGALATGGYGTALGVIRAAVESGRSVKVIACETRPYLQGARLTAWELLADGIDVELCTDAMPASFFARGEIDAVVVGADRVARNGDVANKIGTYSHAVMASFHARPFYVAAPRSTLDPACARGADIPIEQRSADEVVRVGDRSIAPHGVRVRHPGFDVTPAHLITRLVTEVGDVPGPEAASLMA